VQRVMLKYKIHPATVTDCDSHCVGSITVDADLPAAADVLEYGQVHVVDVDNGDLLAAADVLECEQVHRVDVDNGARFVTCAIAGAPGSGQVKVSGAVARLVHRGDTVSLFSHADYDAADIPTCP